MSSAVRKERAKQQTSASSDWYAHGGLKEGKSPAYEHQVEIVPLR